VENPHTRRMKTFAAVLFLAMVTACSMLPAVGPSKKQIYEGSVQRSGNSFVVEVDDHVTREANSINHCALIPHSRTLG